MPAFDVPTEFDRLLALRGTGLLDGRQFPGFEEICQEARDRLGVPTALVTLVDHDRLVVAAGAAGDPSPRCDAFCDHTIRSDDILVIPDLSLDARFDGNPLVVGAPFFRFYAGAPLTYGRGLRLGALCVLDTKPRDFSSGDRAELAELADRVVALIGEHEFRALPGRAAL
jgi:GAF domain-containing protein